jgi:hypothetical protein
LRKRVRLIANKGMASCEYGYGKLRIKVRKIANKGAAKLRIRARNERLLAPQQRLPSGGAVGFDAGMGETAAATVGNLAHLIRRFGFVPNGPPLKVPHE